MIGIHAQLIATMLPDEVGRGIVEFGVGYLKTIRVINDVKAYDQKP